MDGDLTYSYAVNPRTLLMVDDLPRTRQNKIYNLTKDQVRQALKCANVYRRFSNTSVRVIPSNLDRLHNEVLYTEEEWNKIVDKELYSTGKVTDPDNQEPVEPAVPVNHEVNHETSGLVNGDALQTSGSVDVQNAEDRPNGGLPAGADGQPDMEETDSKCGDSEEQGNITQQSEVGTEEIGSDGLDTGVDEAADDSIQVEKNYYSGKKKKRR